MMSMAGVGAGVGAEPVAGCMGQGGNRVEGEVPPKVPPDLVPQLRPPGHLQPRRGESGRSWEFGKAFGRSGPLGPLHPLSKVWHPPEERIELKVNGALPPWSAATQWKRASLGLEP